MNDNTKVRRVTAVLEGNFREVAKIDAAEFFGKKVDRLLAEALVSTGEPTKRQRISEWMQRKQERAAIDRVTNILCPPEPGSGDYIDAVRYALNSIT